jgi:similar to stage IV sporulation protein
MVWKVEIEGAEKIPPQNIKKALELKGVHFGQLKSRLPETSTIQNEILAQFPHLSWVGFRVEGTRVVLTVVEKKRAEIHKSEYFSYALSI